MAEKDLKQMFLQKRPCMILLAVGRIKKPYVSALMKEADTTFAHTTNILSEMESCGLVRFVSEGRVKYVKLTPLGRRVLRSLKSLDSLLEGRHLLVSFEKVQKRLDAIESLTREGPQDEKAISKRIKQFERAAAKAEELKAEASLYNNPALDGQLNRLKERLTYLDDRVRHGMRP